MLKLYVQTLDIVHSVNVVAAVLWEHGAFELTIIKLSSYIIQFGWNWKMSEYFTFTFFIFSSFSYFLVFLIF